MLRWRLEKLQTLLPRSPASWDGRHDWPPRQGTPAGVTAATGREAADLTRLYRNPGNVQHQLIQTPHATDGDMRLEKDLRSHIFE